LLGYGAWANSMDAANLTALYYATVGGHTECVMRLLAARADTEVFDDSGKAPLHQACFNSQDAIAALLIDYGANVNSLNGAGNTPLHVSAARNARECARWLLLRGAERERPNKSGQT
ncbi:ankyrin repeat-containing domain protein, partial [Blyttiomyces helicus]